VGWGAGAGEPVFDLGGEGAGAIEGEVSRQHGRYSASGAAVMRHRIVTNFNAEAKG